MDPGDRIRVEAASGIFEGVYLPSEDPDVLVLKLDNGYNIGITSVKSTMVLERFVPSKKVMKTIISSKHLPTIAILHTGGTIASKIDYKTGAVTADFSPQELLAMFPELQDMAVIDSQLIRQMMSENMRFAHYNLLAMAVDEQVKRGVDGIIITHGTDTMHYSSAALAFALEDIPIPVILVGAQRSSDRGSSDAALNLLSAVLFVTKSDFAGVAVCMHESMNDDACLILPATKVRKMHTSRRDAFRPINASAFARVDYRKKSVKMLTKYPSRGARRLTLKLFDEKLKIGLLKVHTQMFAEEFEAYKRFDGLVVEGTALGQLPNANVDEFTSEHDAIHKALGQLSKKMPVVMSSQSLYGRVDMNVYAEGRMNIKLGVLGNFSDMTPETTFIKLAWLLSNHPDQVKELIGKDLRGEISDRLEDDTFLV